MTGPAEIIVAGAFCVFVCVVFYKLFSGVGDGGYG